MDNNDSFTPQEKKDNNRQTVISSLMVMAILLIAELYVMINMPGNIAALAVVTILFLGSAYFFGKSILKEIHESDARAREQYEAIAKSGKASYLLLKKTIEQLEEMEGNSNTPAEDIITAQKAIAKVTINRSKESADALMNSNDRVLEKIFDFEENLGNNQSILLDKQRQLMDDSMKELMIKQQEMTSTMKAMEESIKSELLQAVGNIQMVQPQQTVEAQPELVMEKIDFNEPEPMMDDFDLGEPEAAMEDFDLGEPEMAMEDLDLGEPEMAMEDLDLGEPEMAMENLDLGEPEMAMEDLDLGEPEMAMEDLDLGEPEMAMEDLDLGESEMAIEDFDLGEPSLSADLDLGIDLIPEEELVAEQPEFVESMPEQKDVPPMPDISDPNKLMTPEEIAALIANL